VSQSSDGIYLPVGDRLFDHFKGSGQTRCGLESRALKPNLYSDDLPLTFLGWGAGRPPRGVSSRRHAPQTERGERLLTPLSCHR